MTADEFARQYAERSGVTVEWLREQGHEVRPCECDYDACEGWQMARVRDWMPHAPLSEPESN